MVEKKNIIKLAAAPGLDLQAPRSNLNLTTAEIRPSFPVTGVCLSTRPPGICLKNDGQNSLEIGCGSYCLQ